MAREANWQETERLARVGTNLVVDRIQRLGLKVVLNKTGALWFYGLQRRPSQTQLRIGEALIHVGSPMKYLGHYLDNH